MKLKGLNKRAHNVLFHTHTVSGIAISFALFVIFYAGAFSLFRDEIGQWENPDMQQLLVEEVNLDQAVALVDSAYQLNYYQTTSLVLPTKERPVLYVYGAYHNTDTTTQRLATYLSPIDHQIHDIRAPKTTVGDTLYHLHYFDQIPLIGLYLSGLVALFFLFATITGLLIHWKNLITKFYAFITAGSNWKKIWINAHIVFGLIGLPFQVIYAITGAFFGLLTLILLPGVFLLYDGDSSKVFAKAQPYRAISLAQDAPDADHLSLDVLADQVQSSYPDYHIRTVQLRNYSKDDGVASWYLNDRQNLAGSGVITMSLKDGALLEEYSVLPQHKTYSNKVIDYIAQLHFGTFGGPMVRIMYFVLAMITCFMIISGVLIWRTARDNKKYNHKQRLFHHRVTKVYLAICLSMFPAFAIIFMANKLVPMELDGRVGIVNIIFFSSWLLLTVVGLFWNKYAQQNRNYLLMGGLLSLTIPLLNGLMADAWVWKMIEPYPAVAYVDLFWLFTGLAALYVSIFLLKVKTASDKPEAPQLQEPVAEKVPAKASPSILGFFKLNRS
ncbi:MAG: PepSY-associated TM helix domain-containing protein [Bacteroidota bacterium]